MENLEEVNYQALTLEQSLQALTNGKVLLVKGLEQRRKLDVLVRLFTEGLVPVTQISYDITPADGHWRKDYWQIYDLPINALSTYPCFLYDSSTGAIPKYMIGANVLYTSKEDSIQDTALVIATYKNEEGKFFYKLSRDGGIYSEEELKGR